MEKPSIKTVKSCELTCSGSNTYHLKIRWENSMAKPGQFVMLEPLKSSCPMPRPFSIAKYDKKGISLFIKVVGENTKLYSMLKRGEKIKVTGPLGKAIPTSNKDGDYLLIGGGIGSVALLAQAKKLASENKNVFVMLGGKNIEDVSILKEFKKLNCVTGVVVESESGKLVTDALETALKNIGGKLTIISCGPRAMLKKVAEIAKEHKKKCLVILEELMACGMGSCKGCAVFGKDGTVRHVCSDGPAFNANWIDWEKFLPARISIESRNEFSPKKTARNPLKFVRIVGHGRRRLILDYPILNASGCLGEEALESGLVNFKHAGALVTKGVTLRGRSGNDMPRICEVPYGMLNSIGLENPGTKDFIKKKLPIWLATGKPIIVNVSGFSVEEYAESCSLLSETKIAGLEVNISCPNIDQGQGSKKFFGLDRDLTYKVVSGARNSARGLFFIVKLSPMASDIVEIAKAAKDAGADAFSLINTFSGMSIDIHTKKSKIGNSQNPYGGMSGSVIKPLAIRIIHQLYSANLGLPIIGMGGILRGIDAPEFILAGANAVATGTGLFPRPSEIIPEIHTELENFVRFHEAKNLQELVGKVNT